MELSLVESLTPDTGVAKKLSPWETGHWLVDKFYEPGFVFNEVSVDHTTEGFDERNLVRLGGLAVEAA